MNPILFPALPPDGKITCPECGKRIALRPNGMLWLHGPRGVFCLGAFRDPNWLPNE